MGDLPSASLCPVPGVGPELALWLGILLGVAATLFVVIALHHLFRR